MIPKNSSPYRKPPLRKTRDSFLEDKNLSTFQDTDVARPRSTQIRRDKDKVRSVGITLYDIDFAVKSFIEQSMRLRIEDNGELISVPTIYANSEKWASIQRNGYLKDKKGKTLVPLITFRRSGVNMKSELRRNKVASTNQLAHYFKQRYNKNTPYDKFSSMYGVQNKTPHEYFVTPIPDYVDVTYDFILWTEYQSQLNFIVEQFVYFTGQSFGERNFLKFATNTDSFTMEDNNTTGQDRIVRASFQITVHGYLLPKSVAGEVTTKRVISANRISFDSEVSTGDSLSAYDRLLASMGAGAGGGNIAGLDRGLNRNPQIGQVGTQGSFQNRNADLDEISEELARRKQELIDISINSSPDVYSTEND